MKEYHRSYLVNAIRQSKTVEDVTLRYLKKTNEMLCQINSHDPSIFPDHDFIKETKKFQQELEKQAALIQETINRAIAHKEDVLEDLRRKK